MRLFLVVGKCNKKKYALTVGRGYIIRGRGYLIKGGAVALLGGE